MQDPIVIRMTWWKKNKNRMKCEIGDYKNEGNLIDTKMIFKHFMNVEINQSPL